MTIILFIKRGKAGFGEKRVKTGEKPNLWIIRSNETNREPTESLKGIYSCTSRYPSSSSFSSSFSSIKTIQDDPLRYYPFHRSIVFPVSPCLFTRGPFEEAAASFSLLPLLN